jgi:TRAP-type mannitol/chloroaromatic compound transport system permease small subunit
MPYRARAWLELFGCLLLALPYIALVAYYSLEFVAQSYWLGEQSDSTVGLTHRWIIKGVYAVGLWLVVLGIVSVLLRIIVFLFGKKSEQEVNLQIGHVIADV